MYTEVSLPNAIHPPNIFDLNLGIQKPKYWGTQFFCVYMVPKLTHGRRGVQKTAQQKNVPFEDFTRGKCKAFDTLKMPDISPKRCRP